MYFPLHCRRLPNPLVFLSYIFCFQGLLAGPLCFFNDYISFVEGKNFPIEKPLVIDTASLKKRETEKRRKAEDLEPEVSSVYTGTRTNIAAYPLLPGTLFDDFSI